MSTTWNDIQEYVRSKYKLAEDRDNSFKLVFEYQNKRLQAVIVSRFESLGRDWVDFASAACKLDQLDPETALRKNFQFAVGGLCLDRDQYVMRNTIEVATMNLDEFELQLHIVASTADKIDQTYS